MIHIINQHRGSYSELCDHLDNYILNHYSDKFFMTLIIDGVDQLDQEQIAELDKLSRDHKDIMTINFNYKCTGLSQCRFLANASFKYESHPRFNEDSQILFGCSNCLYNCRLDDALYSYLIQNPDHPSIIYCEYKNDPWTRNHSAYIGQDRVSYEYYFSDVNKPDFSIMIPAKFRDRIDAIAGEKYYPEELILSKILFGDFTDDADRYLNVYYEAFQYTWYNETGMSKTFNRFSILNNRVGFLHRAKMHLRLWKDGKLNIGMERLKGLVYDLATLGEYDSELMSNTLLEPLYWWAVQKWCSNPEYSHKIKFIEDESKY